MASMNNRRASGESGQAIIELALTLPLLLVIVLGIFDFGLMFQRYEVVTNAAREGSRVGVLPGYAVGDAQERAKAYLSAGGIDASAAVVSAGCQTSGLALSGGTVCVSATKGASPTFGTPPKTVQQITTTVSYDHEFTFVGPIMNLLGGSLGTVRLLATSTMRLEAN